MEEILILIIVLVLIYYFSTRRTNQRGGNRNSSTKVPNKASVIANNLYVPWGLAFIPGYPKDFLVTQRNGILSHFRQNEEGQLAQELNDFSINESQESGEGGLLGIAIHPNYVENRWIYLYLTTTDQNGNNVNKVVRYIYKPTRNGRFQLTRDREIIGEIPGASRHDGGFLRFGPDGYLYITTGDAGVSDYSQDLGSLAGKILRISDNGSIPADNPFTNSPIYSYGHRNPQGLTWDSKGQLWAIDHGRSGWGSGLDEVNLIKKGGNYGWPIIQGEEESEGMETPIIQSGPNITWAPAGILYKDGKIYFTGLRGEGIYSAKIGSNNKFSNLKKNMINYGRLRAIVENPFTNTIWFSTSNRDGRGRVNEGDDKIYFF